MMREYVKRFEKLGFGLFVHFGLYSVLGQGEWYYRYNPSPDLEAYMRLPERFDVRAGWAEKLVETAKSAGCRYITLTTRHHDGFSLYDTRGIDPFDAPHSASGRDLIEEFTAACRAGGVVPFFYHTMRDWRHPDFKTNFPAYMDYLIASFEVLCRNYGEIGGFWLDGMCALPDADWQEDRLYGMIRRYQPEAMIINNMGLDARGVLGHPEIDCVVFERGKPRRVEECGRPVAGEMCQVLNDHWGYAADDCNYKSVGSLIEDLVDCRGHGCNFLLNTGLRGDGSVNPTDACLLGEVGKWVLANAECVYRGERAEIKAENAVVLRGDNCLYAAVKNVPLMDAVGDALGGRLVEVKLAGVKIRSAEWLDTGKKIQLTGENSFRVQPFDYGTSRFARVAKITL